MTSSCGGLEGKAMTMFKPIWTGPNTGSLAPGVRQRVKKRVPHNHCWKTLWLKNVFMHQVFFTTLQKKKEFDGGC